MNVRETSIEAYHKIKDSGLLSELLLKHLLVFYELRRPVTAREAHDAYCGRHPVEKNLNQFRSKVTMLKDQGALEELEDKVVCPVSKMTVTLYQVTNNATTKPKTLSKPQRMAIIRMQLIEIGRKAVNVQGELNTVWKTIEKL